LEGIVATKETIGRNTACIPSAPETFEPASSKNEVVDQVVEVAENPEQVNEDPISQSVEQPDITPEDERICEIKENPVEETGIYEPSKSNVGKKNGDICNLCGDPVCSRKKGDPKVTCIHYERNNKEDE
jgi:hypothetical protein